MVTTHSNTQYKNESSTVKWAQWDKTQSRRAWPQYILRRLRLTQNVITHIALQMYIDQSSLQSAGHFIKTLYKKKTNGQCSSHNYQHNANIIKIYAYSKKYHLTHTARQRVAQISTDGLCSQSEYSNSSIDTKSLVTRKLIYNNNKIQATT